MPNVKSGYRRFQSTPSVWRETPLSSIAKANKSHFNPLPPCGGRPIMANSLTPWNDFNPLPPCGGRLVWRWSLSVFNHFNPLPPCGGRLCTGILTQFRRRFQSTPSVWRETRGTEHRGCYIQAFQSTPSVWRETSRDGHSQRERTFQSTPSVWRETRCERFNDLLCRISIHSLRVEGDVHHGQRLRCDRQISIHSLRVEGDAAARV